MIISENNWINDNFTPIGLVSDYNVKFNLYPFKPLDFHTAAEQAVMKISKKYQNLYVGLSGGIDSEYVLICFHKLKIPIIPLIILCEGNEQESKYALKICEKLNIVPKVITCSNDVILDICVNYISKKINMFEAIKSYIPISNVTIGIIVIIIVVIIYNSIYHLIFGRGVHSGSSRGDSELIAVLVFPIIFIDMIYTYFNRKP